METPNNNPSLEAPKPQRRRSRKADGKFEGDGQGLNTHLESTEIIDAIGEKTVNYSVKQKVEGTSQNRSGKYGKNKKVNKPTFGKVYTVSN